MAELRIDESRQHVLVDLHGYGLSHARKVARQKVREAWENGYAHITLIHGAAAARRPGMAWGGGYGRIKWHLRRLFSSGKWRSYLYHDASRKHRLEDGCMRLAVRPNPAARVPASWEPLPAETYACGAGVPPALDAAACVEPARQAAEPPALPALRMA